MKKYFKLLMVALFATMSFTLTSCGDDNDEPDGGNGKSSFTINGQSYYVHEVTGATPTFTNFVSGGIAKVDLEMYANSDKLEFFPRVHVNIETEALSAVSKGVKLQLTDNKSTYVEYVTDIMKGDKYGAYKSGSVTIEAVSESSVTLKFDKVKFADDDNKTITLNGTINCEYFEY